MKKVIVIAFCAFGALLAQGPNPDPSLPIRMEPFPPELRAFLQLTQEQVNNMVRTSAEYTAYFARRQTRIAQVELDIRRMTNAEPLDPAGLGIRMAEVEAIRRDLREQEVKHRQQLLGILTAAQRTRLQILEEAQKLAPRINEAQCVNLMPGAGGISIPGLVGQISDQPLTGFLLGLPALNCVPKAPPPVQVPDPIRILPLGEQ